jgi:hypothetical protein
VLLYLARLSSTFRLPVDGFTCTRQEYVVQTALTAVTDEMGRERERLSAHVPARSERQRRH